MCLYVQLVTSVLEKHIDLVVAIERPVILIEASERHNFSIVYVDRLHVQVFKRFLLDLGTILPQSFEQVAIQVRFIDWLVTVTSSDNL